MDLTIVGCSGSVPGPDSPGSCYLVSAEHDDKTWQILLDLGSGALGALQRHTDPLTLDAVLLSHLHPDHCLDLTALHVMRRHGPTPVTGDLEVYAPEGAAERMARAYGVESAKPLTGISWHDLADAQPFQVGPFTITPYAVNHPVPAFGFRVECGGRTLAYTGDTDSCPGLLPLMRHADLVLAEAAFVDGRDAERGIHLTGRRAAKAALEADVTRLMLTHVPPWNDPAAALAEAERVLDPTSSGDLVSLAQPGASYPV